MKKQRFSVEQIASVLQQAAGGMAVGDVCRQVGISEQTFYRWKKDYGGMLPSEARELKQLRDENAKLKRLVAELSLDKVMLQDVVQKKFSGSSWNRVGDFKHVLGMTASSQRGQHAGEDLEPEVLFIAEPIGAALEDTDLVV